MQDFKFDDENSQYQVEQIGHIKCLHPEHQHPLVWCQHLADACRTRTDCAAIWFFPGWEITELAERELSIPIFPTMDLWTAVNLVPHERFRRYAVYWTHGHATNDLPEFVTNVSPGEGRQVIRMSLIEYMIGKIDVKTTECKAGHHGVQAQSIWEVHMRQDNTAVPEFWSVFTTDMCVDCQKNLGSFDDLVPDKERNVWNPYA